MLDPALGRFDHVVAMDSLIHYEGIDIARALAALAARTRRSIAFTIAPRTPALTVMHAVGRLFPRGDRAPAIEPISPKALARRMRAERDLDGWRMARAHRVTSGFYLSHAVELTQR
jgi:magnesium-protoporphyrin O-methyltransferase